MSDKAETHYTYNTDTKEQMLDNLNQFAEKFPGYIPYCTVLVMGLLPKTDLELLGQVVKDGGLLSTVDLRAFNREDLHSVLDKHQKRIDQIREYINSLPESEAKNA